MPELHCVVLEFGAYWWYDVWDVVLGSCFERGGREIGHWKQAVK